MLIRDNELCESDHTIMHADTLGPWMIELDWRWFKTQKVKFLSKYLNESVVDKSMMI